ncbi:hypothetical protein HRU87_02275 [Aquiluna borgnonia]|uniref:Capsule polysaccharide biosynthesis protein n=1 Tax=Aquiluna borgnonia TaxID=2499157 RepID=A0A7D4QMI5_9MICO|nr:hypothetical protein [Aquiluna borgnonia]QKJ25047.1 hypothetical protein HRU87_02275 [Aquiluna borgnonia]
MNSAAGIWAHSASDSLLLNRLSHSGAKISTVSCDGVFEGLCAVRMSRNRTLREVQHASGLDCKDCKFTSKLTSLAARVPAHSKHWLGDFITALSRHEAKSFLSKWQSMDSPPSLEFGGVNVPQVAAYEVALKYKSWEAATTGEGLADYMAAIHDTALMVLAAHEFFRTHSRFSTLLIRSPHYSTNRAFALVAKNRGIRVVFLDGSPNISEDYTHLMIWDWGLYSSSNPAISYFDPSVQEEIGTSECARIDSHLQALQAGKSHKVYSEPKATVNSTAGSLAIDVNKPSALLALSSTDEITTSLKTNSHPRVKYPGTVFQDQFEWVQETVAWFRDRPNYQMVIRVHPREFPNKREALTSPAGIRWEQELAKLPPNVLLNHPKDGLSIYDIFEEVNVVVTGWSSAGLEAAIQGIPLITYDSDLPGYPSAIGLSGKSKSEYFENLEKALEGQVSKPFKKNAMQWMNLWMNMGTSRVGGRFLAAKRNLLPRWITLSLEGLDRYLYFIYRPLDLLRGILIEPTDRRYEKVILEGKKDLYQ